MAGILVRSTPARVTTPILVLAGENDAAVAARETRATGRAFGTDPEFLPDMGHDLMLERGWTGVAERIRHWLAARRL